MHTSYARMQCGSMVNDASCRFFASRKTNQMQSAKAVAGDWPWPTLPIPYIKPTNVVWYCVCGGNNPLPNNPSFYHRKTIGVNWAIQSTPKTGKNGYRPQKMGLVLARLRTLSLGDTLSSWQHSPGRSCVVTTMECSLVE